MCVQDNYQQHRCDGVTKPTQCLVDNGYVSQAHTKKKKNTTTNSLTLRTHKLLRGISCFPPSQHTRIFSHSTASHLAKLTLTIRFLSQQHPVFYKQFTLYTPTFTYSIYPHVEHGTCVYGLGTLSQLYTIQQSRRITVQQNHLKPTTVKQMDAWHNIKYIRP